MEARQLRSYCLRIVLWFFFLIVGGCAFFRYVPHLLNDGSVTGALRGSHIINMRRSTSPEEIAIFDTGRASRYIIAAPADAPATTVQLSPAVFHTLVFVQTLWCTTPPQFRAPNTTESYYDIGLLCGTFTKRSFRIPDTLMPTAFTAVNAEIPALP